MKKKWKPELNEHYYLPSVTAGGFYRRTYWSNDLYDKLNYKRDLVCRTKKEATLKAKSMLDFLKHQKED